VASASLSKLRSPRNCHCQPHRTEFPQKLRTKNKKAGLKIQTGLFVFKNSDKQDGEWSDATDPQRIQAEHGCNEIAAARSHCWAHRTRLG